MKNLLLALMVVLSSITTTMRADDISIPTTTENPFDLTKGVITSNDTHQHFTNNGLEWMIDGDHITFTLQNEQDVDYYFVTVNADTGNNGVTIDFSLKTEKDDAVADTTFSIENRGWYQASPYQTKIPAMKKGRYTLTLTFHSSPGNTTGNVKSISFKPSMYTPVPTTADNPFDLNLGFLEGRGLSINNANEIDNGRNGYRTTFGIDNTEDVDYYLLSFKAGTTRNDAQFHITVTAADGTKVCDQTVPLTNNGTWTANRMYAVKTAAMKKGRYTVVFDFISTGNEYAARLADIAFNAPPQAIAIPTDDDHPFDLTKAFVFSSTTNKHFTDYGVEYMYNDNQLIYTVQCQDDLDVCNVYVGSDTNYGEVTLDFSLTSLSGDAVVDTTWQIASKGWYKPDIYSTQLKKLKKGTYTLTLTFHQSKRTDWSACNIASIAFKIPQQLKPGDNVDIVNAEFDDGLNGWNRTGDGWNGTLDIDGNKSAASWFNYGTGQLSQTIYNLPNGLYMLRLCAYDGANYMTGNTPQEQETYIFANDQMKLMKTAFDESVSYRNIYRWRTGKNGNSNYRHSTDGRWVPTQGVDWNEAQAMTKHFYENCLIVPVTNGKVTFGWKKTGNSGNLRIAYDHATLTYLSDKTSISETERAELESKQITDDYEARLNSQLSILNSQLSNGQPHAPQAVAAANSLIATDKHEWSQNELIDEILRAGHTVQRLQLPFYEVTVSDGSPSGLADQLAALGIETTDTIALKLNGTPTNDDLATLKTLKNIMEVDLSATTLTTLPNDQFNNRMYLLTWVTLPSQLETIGNSTFHDCPELRDLQLPATLKSVGDYAFRYSYNFYHANIPEGLTAGNGVFRNSGIRKLTLPSSMKNVSNYLCADCYDLLDIQFNGQVNIGSNAFWACYALKTINIPEGVERLNSSCFGNCTGLTSATLPSTLLTVTAPFHNSRNLKEVTCLTIAPPFPNNTSIHGDLTSKGFTLYVPKQSVEEYQEANKWNEFNVEGIDVLPPTISIISNITLDVTDAQPADYKPNVRFSGLYYYWGNNVSSVATVGKLTVNGSEMFSTGNFELLWYPFATRSLANREKIWGDTYSSLVNNGHLRADNVTVNLSLYTDCWEFISFPFDVRVGDIRYRFPDVPLVIYGYDTQKRAEGKMSETWVRMTADSILHAGHGYIFQTTIPTDQVEERKKGYEDLNFHFNTFFFDALQNVNKPKIFRSDDVEITLQKTNSEFAHDRSWNFIGNPYPCYFNIQDLETTAPIIIWYFTNSSNGQYRAYSPLDDNLILYPGQAFFIQCPLDNDRIVFHREGRTNNMRYDESRSMTRATDHSRQVFNILLQSDEASSEAAGGTLDRTRFVINEAASLDYEPGRDASKFPAMDASATELYTVRDGVRYAIDERPLSDGTVRLGLTVPTPGTYTIALADVPDGSPSGSITLIDRETGTETDLTANSYTFQAAAGTTEARFLVRLNGTAVTSVQSVAVLQQQTEQLYDLQGRPVSNPQPGIYVRNNKKVIIK